MYINKNDDYSKYSSHFMRQKVLILKNAIAISDYRIFCFNRN